MPDKTLLLSCGDALIDFVPNRTADGREAYVPAVGGSCLNVAVAMARLGAPTGFVGGVSSDLFGEQIAAHLAASGVRPEYMRRSAHETTLAFVKMDGADARYAFYDETTAARLWTYDPASVPLDPVAALHVGSVPLINDPSASAYEALVAAARGRCIVSLDPNCRPSLVSDLPAYRARIDRLAAHSDIVRMSDADFAFLYPEAVIEHCAASWLAAGAGLVLITRGEHGATAFARSGRLDVPSAKVKVVDTIGAGDTFQGAMLVALSEAGLLNHARLAAMSQEEIATALAFATTAAGITCSRPGADPPWRRDMNM
jgi:fructokinase